MPPHTDVFPATAVSWLGRRVAVADEAALAQARRHIMSVYYHPLSVYIKGSSFRTLGDAEDIVSGFFASRLSRPDYLARWTESGVPLRGWLMRGLKYYCMERLRSERRDLLRELPDDAPDSESTPGSAFHHELGKSLITEAVRLTAASLEAEGLGGHWEVFRRHHLERKPFASVAEEFGITERRAGVMSRTAARRLRRQVRSLCAWPGASDAEVDDEVKSFIH